MPIRTAIIDDHEAIRYGMQAAFDRADDPRVELVGAASTVDEFLHLRSDAEVVLLDLRLADDSDPQALSLIHI